MPVTGAAPPRGGAASRHVRRWVASALMALLTLTLSPASHARGGEFPWSLCADCDLLVGVGTTYRLFSNATGGLVIPVSLDFAAGRWEIGVFRFATYQKLAEFGFPARLYSATPYWAYTVSRRWNVFNPSWGKVFVGFGGEYKTTVDVLDATRWDFAYQMGVRLALGHTGALLELNIRHWSNAGTKLPNRGENFATVSVAF